MAADLRRLERACGPALTANPVCIDFQLGHVTDMDAAAAAFVERMMLRGATLVGLMHRS
jgi:hypothetical protein